VQIHVQEDAVLSDVRRAIEADNDAIVASAPKASASDSPQQKKELYLELAAFLPVLVSLPPRLVK
jgi:hypothetical protein